MKSQTQTPEFRRWFAGSVVTNPDGSPMVVYHFTRAAGFGRFKRSPKDIGFHFGTREQAQDRFRSIWEQRTDPRIPIETGEWKLGTLAVYLRITKPLRLPDLGIWGADNLRFELERLFPAKIKEIRSIRTTAQARDFITAMGYDGIVYRNTGEVAGSAEYARRVREARLAMPEDLQRLSAFSPEDQKHPAYQKWSKAMEEYRAFREANAQDSWIAFDQRQVKSATGNRGTFDPKDPDIRNPRRNPVKPSPNLHWLVRQISEPEDRVLDYAASKVGDLYHLYDLVYAGNVLGRVQSEERLHQIFTEIEGLLDDRGVFLFDYEPGPVGTPELLGIATQHFKEVGRVKFPGLQGTLYAARGPLNPEEARINAEKERRK